MRRVLLAVSAISLSTLALAGCKTVDEKRADYHEWRAQRAADKGNDGVALEQQRKAEKARANLATDKLP